LAFAAERAIKNIFIICVHKILNESIELLYYK